EIAMQGKIPMRVRSNYSTEPGTLITSSKPEEADAEGRSDQLITGIAHMDDVTQIQIETGDEAGKHQLHVFKAMADAGISVDFINISAAKIIYTIPHSLTDKAVQILEALEYTPKITKNCA